MFECEHVCLCVGVYMCVYGVHSLCVCICVYIFVSTSVVSERFSMFIPVCVC